MNYLEITFWTSEKSCIYFLQQHPTFWNNNPILKARVELLFDSEQSIEDYLLKQSENKENGLKNKKDDGLHSIIKKCYRIDRKLTLYAKLSNNQVLLKDADISESAFLDKGLNASANTCITVLNIARQYLPQLAGYDITAQYLDTLETEINTAKTLPAELQVGKNEHKILGNSIKNELNNARTILDHLDDGFEAFIEDEDFINGWFEARKIKGRHNPPKTPPTTPQV
jgi:hypothetical protein